MKKILLILSHLGKKQGFFEKFLYTTSLPSITLEQLVSITPDKYEVKCFDERWENVDFDWDGDIVGISTQTLSANHAYNTADEFRRRGKTVVLGGYHPSASPDEAKQHAHSIVIGEAEISWPQLLRDFENGRLKPFYRAMPVDPKMIPSPRRIVQNYSSMGMVQATRGCPQGCKYCSVQNVEGIALRSRPIKNVIEEVASIEENRFFFADSSMTNNSKYTKQLFQEMIGLNKKFSCYGNIHVLKNDDELLDLANRAGCETWLIGFESVSKESIDYIGKKSNKVKEYESGVKKIRDYGMMIMGLFMFGFDTDKPDIFNTTLNAINKMELNRAAFSIVTPFPGTELFNQLEKEGRILTKDWSKYNLRNVVFQPKNMSAKQLAKGRNSMVKEFYSLRNCIRRGFQDTNPNFNRLFVRTMRDYFFNNIYNF